MTTRNQDPTHDPLVRCWADIEVYLTPAPDHVLAFKATDRLKVDVSQEGMIHILEPIGPDERAELRFTLEDGYELKGIQLAVTEGDWGPWMLDTDGAYYQETPFKISNLDPQPPTRNLVLTQIGGLEPPTANPHYYQLEVYDGERLHRIDPKIYNTGPESPPGHKGKNR